MNPIARLDQAVAQWERRMVAQLKATIRIGTHRPWWGSVTLGRTAIDYARDVGDGRGNAAVMACVLWMCRTFTEAPIRVMQELPDGEEEAKGHPLTRLLRRPNPYYSGELLLRATIADWCLGNAYWVKLRNPAGQPVQLWWVPARQMEPMGEDRSDRFITHYEWRYSSTEEPAIIPQAEVVHLRHGLDPNNMRKGLSPLGALVREIFTDDEAASFSATLLRNLGVPGVVVSPGDPNVSLTAEQAEAAKARWEQTFGGDNRGRVLVAQGKTDVQVLSFSPEQMNLKDIRRLPEERITAIFGVPAIVVGLGAGLDRSTFANYAEAREAAYESNVIPTQRLIAADLTTQLLADFVDIERGFSVGFDLSGVRVLQEDENAKAARVALLYEKGVLKRSEARLAMGHDAAPEDEVYMSEAAPPTADETGQSTVEEERPPLRRVAGRSNGHHTPLTGATVTT